MRTIMGAGLAIVLLASACTASAECAWVLWQQLVAQDQLGNVKKPYEPLAGQYGVMHAYRDQDGCEAALRGSVKAKPEGRGLLICLPDTIDPRGPKGK
jgi:hypothetical protein